MPPFASTLSSAPSRRRFFCCLLGSPASRRTGTCLGGDSGQPELRYPSGHPQLTLLKAVEVRPSTAVAIELPARLIWNEARTQRIYAPLAGRVTAIRADVVRPSRPVPCSPRWHRRIRSGPGRCRPRRRDTQLATKNLKRQRNCWTPACWPARNTIRPRRTSHAHRQRRQGPKRAPVSTVGDRRQPAARDHRWHQRRRG